MCDSVRVSWLDTLLHWRECRADIRHNSDGQFLLETFTNLPAKWWSIWTMFSLPVEQYVAACPYEQEISKQRKLASNSQRYKKSGYEILAHLCLGSLERRCTSMRSRRSRRRLGMTCQTRIPPTNLSARSRQRVPLMSVSLSCGMGCSWESIMLKKEACLYLDGWVIDTHEELELVPERWTAAKKEGGVALNRFIKRAQFSREPRLTRKCLA